MNPNQNQEWLRRHPEHTGCIGCSSCLTASAMASAQDYWRRKVEQSREARHTVTCDGCGEPYRGDAMGWSCTHAASCREAWKPGHSDRIRAKMNGESVGKSKRSKAMVSDNFRSTIEELTGSADPPLESLLDELCSAVNKWNEAEQDVVKYGEALRLSREDAVKFKQHAVTLSAAVSDAIARGKSA